MIAAAHPPLTTETIADSQGFDSLKHTWDELVGASRSSVFQTHSWLRVWWRHFGERHPLRELHLVLVKRGADVVAIAPFYIDSTILSRLARTRQLRFLSDEVSDYGDMILLPGHEEEALRAIASHLAGLWKSIDSISLQHIPDASASRCLMTEMLVTGGVPASLVQADTCTAVDLLATWDETLDGIENSKRKFLLKKHRTLMRAARVEFEITSDPLKLGRDLTDFVNLHQQRMTEVGNTGFFSHHGNESFLREIYGELLGQGRLMLSFLSVNGKRVAASCSYHFANRVSAHLSGLGEEEGLLKLSPGIVMHFLCMREACRRKAVAYDFLRGTEGYKYRMGASNHPVWRIHAHRIRPGVRILGHTGTLVRRSRGILSHLKRSDRNDTQTPCNHHE
jgi:CelD/BcsL family acetyltransferase involved in cellulose biosynthesis